MKGKTISRAFALFFALILITTLSYSQDSDKKKAKLMDDYGFTYEITPTGRCCYEVIVWAPVDPGDAYHQFKVIANDIVEVPYSNDFTYWNKGTNNEESFTICFDESYEATNEIEIKVVCNASTPLDFSDDHTVKIWNESFPNNCVTMGEHCCFIYKFFEEIEAGSTIEYGNIEEDGTRTEQGNINASQLVILADGTQSITICPGEDKTQIDFYVTVTDDKGHEHTTEGHVETNCCNCDHEIISPLIITPVATEAGCDGCSYILDYAGTRELPEWSDCYETLDISFYDENLDFVDTETFDVATFSPAQYGTICIAEGAAPSKLMFEFKKDGNSLDDPAQNCLFEYHLDCTGMIPLYGDIIPEIPDVVDPCIPDCPDSVWKRGGSEQHDYVMGAMVTLSDGTTVEVRYRYYYRDACDYQDIQITEITYVGIIPPGFMYEAEVLQKILEDIVRINEPRFDPLCELIAPGDTLCDETWRVTVGSCWAEIPYVLEAYQGPEFPGAISISETSDELPSLVDKLLEEYNPGLDEVIVYRKKCEDVDCCTQPLKVCRTKIELPTGGYACNSDVFSLSSDNNYVNCENIMIWYGDPTPPVIVYAKQCTPFCDWYDALPTWTSGSLKIIEQQEFANLPFASIRSFHAENLLAVECKLTGNANIQLMVYDETGNVARFVEKQYGGGIHVLKIRTDDYKSGAYFYTIVLNNRTIKSGKFTITK
jgi:hypothetical protein